MILLEPRKRSRIKSAVRFLIRLKAYGDAGGSWLAAIEGLVSIVVGIQNGLAVGFVVLIGLRIARSIVGYIDLKYVRATDYYREFMGRLAPDRVRVISKG